MLIFIKNNVQKHDFQRSYIAINSNQTLARFFAEKNKKSLFTSLFGLFFVTLFLAFIIWSAKTLVDNQTLLLTLQNAAQQKPKDILITQQNITIDVTVLSLFSVAFGIGFIALYALRYYNYLFYKNNIINNNLKLKHIALNPLHFLFSGIHAYFYVKNTLLANLEFQHGVKDGKIENLDLKTTLKTINNPKFDKFVDLQLRFSISDITLAALLLALFIIVIIINKFTALRAYNLNFEYVFAILYAYVFRYFKGMLLAFISDALSLIISGSIGFWFWAYAIVPIVIVLVSSFVFDLYDYKRKSALLFINLMLYVGIVVLAVIFFIKLTTDNPTLSQFRSVNIFGFRDFGTSLAVVLFCLFALITIVINALSLFSVFKKFKNTKTQTWLQTTLIIVALLIFIVVIARWLWGPVANIQFNIYTGRISALAVKLGGSNYYFYLVGLYTFKSFITVPLYTFLLVALFPGLELLKHKYFDHRYETRY